MKSLKSFRSGSESFTNPPIYFGLFSIAMHILSLNIPSKQVPIKYWRSGFLFALLLFFNSSYAQFNNTPCDALDVSTGYGKECDVEYKLDKVNTWTTSPVNNDPSGMCLGTGIKDRDLWFKFTPTGSENTAALDFKQSPTKLPTVIADIGVQVFSASRCGGAFTEVACLNSSGVDLYEVISTPQGSDYYVRVFNTDGSNGGDDRYFDYCVTLTSGIQLLGTANQTLRHDGANWIGNDNIYNNGSDVGIGTTSPISKLDVAGSIRSSALSGSGSGLASYGNDGVLQPLSFTGDQDDVLLGNGTFTNTVNLGFLSLTGGTLSGGLTVNGIVDATSFTLSGSPLVSSVWTTSGSDISYNGGNVAIGGNLTLNDLEVNGVTHLVGALQIDDELVVGTKLRTGEIVGRMPGDEVKIGTKLRVNNIATDGIATAIMFDQAVAIKEIRALAPGQFVEMVSETRIMANICIGGGGALGIGTMAPASKLHVVGDGRIQGALTVDDQLNIGTKLRTRKIESVVSGQPVEVLSRLDVNEIGARGAATAVKFKVPIATDMITAKTPGGVVEMTSETRIKDGCVYGRWGIGTPTPAYELDVIGDIRTTGFIDATQFTLSGSPFLEGKWSESGSDIIYGAGNVGIGTTSPTVKLDVNGSLKALDGRFNEITTNQINSSDNLSGLELIKFGDATTYLSTTYHRLLWLGSGIGTPAAQGFTIGNARYNAPGGFGANLACWLEANIEQRALAPNSIAIGYNLKVASTADYAMVIGSGLTSGAPNICGNNNGTLANSTSNSLMIGFNSNLPTFIVKPASGYGTTGSVEINSGSTPTSALYVKGNISTPSQGGIIHHQGAGVWAWQEVAQGMSNFNTASLRFHVVDRTAPNIKYASDVMVLTPTRVGINTSTPNHALDVCGTIRSHEWIVTAFGCDFVFEEGYSLPTFQQRKDFIKYNHRLMYIQSAKEMQDEGAQMAGTTMGILRNVEEHELYLYQLDENDDLLAKRVTELEEEIKSLKQFIGNYLNSDTGQ